MSNTLRAITLVLAGAFAAPVFAQTDHSAHAAASDAMPQSQLPAACQAVVMPGMEMAPAENAMAGHMAHMDAAHQALMGTMEPMHSDMMTGMMAEDFEAAFVCSMIPHHQGAIAMARVQLEHGEDPWLRELAQDIIDAQEQEIADMIAWLEARP